MIGAGAVGCAAALALARRDVPVALLEAEPRSGAGASATNSGILHMGLVAADGGLPRHGL
jgi:L-2-hydroxyglutarate oxidase LhgO